MILLTADSNLEYINCSFSTNSATVPYAPVLTLNSASANSSMAISGSTVIIPDPGLYYCQTMASVGLATAGGVALSELEVFFLVNGTTTNKINRVAFNSTTIGLNKRVISTQLFNTTVSNSNVNLNFTNSVGVTNIRVLSDSYFRIVKLK
jgi:hypothetical protein